MGGVDDKCTTLYAARIIRNTHALQRTLWELRSILSHVSKSKRTPLMMTPSCGCASLSAHMCHCEADDAGVQQRGGC